MSKTNKNNKQNYQNNNIADDDLNKALGKVVPPVENETPVVPEKPIVLETPATPEPVLDETAKIKADDAELEKFASALNENQASQVRKAAKFDISLALEIAKGYFKAGHPEGLKDEFLSAVTSAVTKLAEEYMVNTDGRVVSVKYPNDSEGVTETTIVDPTAEKAKGNGKRSGGTWGKVAVEDKSGGMHYYDSLGQARTRLGVNTDWAANMFENFEKSGFSITKRPDSKDGSGVEMTAPNEWSTWD